jgi:hypothetical protein
MAGEWETSQERIERLIAKGRMNEDAVQHTLQLWHQRWREGIQMPNGERALVTLDDLYRLLVDPRIWRHPQRIEHVLTGIFELRTALHGRRKGLSRWEEGPQTLVGYVILDMDNRVRTMHVLDERTLRREMRKGELLWRR